MSLGASTKRWPLKPKLWLFWLNIVLQPLIGTLAAVALLSSPELGVAEIAGWLMVVFCFILFLFSARVLQRSAGAQLFIELNNHTLVVPGVFSSRVTSLPLAEISEAKLGTIDAEGVKFRQLHIKASGKARVVLSSQLIGEETFDELFLDLQRRGIRIA